MRIGVLTRSSRSSMGMRFCAGASAGDCWAAQRTLVPWSGRYAFQGQSWSATSFTPPDFLDGRCSSPDDCAGGSFSLSHCTPMTSPTFSSFRFRKQRPFGTDVLRACMLRERAPLGTIPTPARQVYGTRGSACWLMTHPRDRITADHTADRSTRYYKLDCRPGTLGQRLVPMGLHISARRIISSACWAANQRIRLRSPGKVALHDLGSSSPGERHVHQADRLLLGSSGGAGHSRDANSVTRDAALPNAFGQCLLQTSRLNRSVFVNQRFGNVANCVFSSFE